MVRVSFPVLSALLFACVGTYPVHARDSAPECDLFMGDVNGSDTVDEDDFLDLMDYLFGGNGRIYLEVADTNGDGQVSVSDAIRLAAYLHGTAPAPRTDLMEGDANGDGSVDYGDFVAIASWLNGTSDNICMTGADINRDSQLDIADWIGIANRL